VTTNVAVMINAKLDAQGKPVMANGSGDDGCRSVMRKVKP
jgi:hypothetical protein